MGKIRRLRDLSLFMKMLIVISLVCLILTVGNSLILRLTYQAYDEQLYIHAAQVATSFVGQVESEFLQLNSISLSMIGDKGVQDKLTVLRDDFIGSDNWRHARSAMQTYVQSYIYNVDMFDEFCVYTRKGLTIGDARELSDSDKKELETVAASFKGGPHIILYGGNVYFIRQIREIAGLSLDNLGTMIGKIDIHKLMEECSRTYQKSGFGLKISVFADGFPVYVGTDNTAPIENDGWQIQGNQFVSQTTDSRGWKFLVSIPYDDIHKTIRLTISRSFSLALSIAVIAMLCGYYLIKRSTRHLETLMSKIDAYRDGVLPEQDEVLKYVNRYDEFGRLHRHFDRMAYDLKKLNDETYNRMLQQKEAQFKQLQQQIQPHFIFNTLSLITWIAYDHKDTEIAELTSSLSRLLRTSMSFNDKTVSVGDELKLVDDYMLIQSRRFGDRLHYEQMIPQSLYKVQIPQLTIQPVVENSIKYALEEMLETCSINLLARIEGETALIIIEDNGPGIDPEILEKLESHQIEANGHGIGLLNIQKRLQLVFGEQYGLSFHRIEEKTQVWIRVPLAGNEMKS